MSLFMSFITDICSVEDHFIIYNRTIYNFIRMYAGATCGQGSKVRSWIELKCLILYFSCAKNVRLGIQRGTKENVAIKLIDSPIF